MEDAIKVSGIFAAQTARERLNEGIADRIEASQSFAPRLRVAVVRAQGRIVARLISIAVTTPIRLPLISVTSLASIATSVPVPIAKPTSTPGRRCLRHCCRARPTRAGAGRPGTLMSTRIS